MIHMAGGENIFRDVEGGSKKVSDEEIIDRNPDLYLSVGRRADEADVAADA
jgi:ABC-type Fe3+-hydroxamate transport system substrate-binding protein